MTTQKKLHDFIYDCVSEICCDKEYMYAKFAETFILLYKEIFKGGATVSEGSAHVSGIKSDRSANFSWRLKHRVNYMAHNEVTLCCRFSDGESVTQTFELSYGEPILAEVINE